MSTPSGTAPAASGASGNAAASGASGGGGSGATAPTTTVVSPRVGGVIGVVAWVGGSNVTPNTQPVDVL